MRIDRIRVRSVPMRLAEPYRVAYSETANITAVFARVDAGPHSGFGCASPDPDVTGETPGDVARALEVLGAELAAQDPDHHPLLLARAAARAPRAPGALAALDMALWDLRGRAHGLPVWRMLGAVRPRIATFVTIGILTEAETLARARDWIARGFVALKLKGGLDPHADAERLRAVRAAVPVHTRLCLDANQGYDVPHARAVARTAAACAAEFLEQPTPARARQALADLRREGSIPVMADESALTAQDVVELIRADAVDLVNVKLMKCGGLTAGRDLAAVCGAAGLRAMVGCMDEPELGIAAGLALALTSPAVAYADLDGAIGLGGDPTAGCVHLEAGYLSAVDAPGFGRLVDAPW